jgi:hypothetical protein
MCGLRPALYTLQNRRLYMTAGKLFSHQSFIDLFNAIVPNKNRVAVFQDFVMLWSIDLHDGLSKSNALEKEYNRIISRYSEKELLVMGKLFSNLVALCDSEPRDVLSSLCTELGLVNSKPGSLKSISYHPTAEVTSIADKTVYGSVVAECQEINKPFITVQEMDCGTGGKILDFANEVVRSGFQLSEKLFVQGVERNRLLGFMCYLQLRFVAYSRPRHYWRFLVQKATGASIIRLPSLCAIGRPVYKRVACRYQNKIILQWIFKAISSTLP